MPYNFSSIIMKRSHVDSFSSAMEEDAFRKSLHTTADNSYDRFLHKDLFQYYVNNDKIVFLTVTGIEIPIQLAFINKYVPVMKAELESKIGHTTCDKDGSKEIIQITMFDKDTVEVFAKVLVCRYESIEEIGWKGMTNLLKMSHFYQCNLIMEICHAVGLRSITRENICDAINLTTLFNIESWKHLIFKLFGAHKDLFQSNNWKELVEADPKAVALLLTDYLKYSGSKSLLAAEELLAAVRLFHYNLNRKFGVVPTDLLSFYINNDEKVILFADGFEMPVASSLIIKFVPLMRSALETDIVATNDKRILISGFNKESVQLFVEYLIDIDNFSKTIKTLSWEFLTKLLKISFFYECLHLAKACLFAGMEKISNQNVYEAILLMHSYAFSDWDKACIEVIVMSKDIVKSERWKELVHYCPKIIARIFTKFFNE